MTRWIILNFVLDTACYSVKLVLRFLRSDFNLKSQHEPYATCRVEFIDFDSQCEENNRYAFYVFRNERIFMVAYFLSITKRNINKCIVELLNTFF